MTNDIASSSKELMTVITLQDCFLPSIYYISRNLTISTAILSKNFSTTIYRLYHNGDIRHSIIRKWYGTKATVSIANNITIPIPIPNIIINRV